uniref:C2H2-type domain-containing protein n=1 Tax=Rhabditophanes sp. KR3021 TaxID=114890 RepID=A0AC35TWT1_9BILA
LNLLDKGVGTFEILQQTLPTVVLSRLSKMDDACFTEERVIKLFRLSQLQIEHILASVNMLFKKFPYKTQAKLLLKLDYQKKQINELKDDNAKVKATTLSASPNLFGCKKCDKIFISQDFLTIHLKNIHNKPNALNYEEDQILKCRTDQISTQNNSEQSTPWR